MLPALVPLLRRDGELALTDEDAGLLVRMSAATIDRRLAPERAKLVLRPVIAMNAQFKRLKPAARSTPARNGPFQLRQRLTTPGPIDVRQQE
ncbi:hypothetical protein D9M72_382910 [compost metagenome]